ncbi:hypothetical protein SELMODRAFT_405914 [Selaginella moellendorffii]|uniref:PsbP C-terminal domain-containing protein n=1 Tax=Selaginella moellendorffii TaxID=88036 RepID=D8R030_SELML|nr:uncharacterized protein LOC9654732 [Selaginella moellendorffii]EFJ34512.1 hypothetical protein SELMODRAFT_405914 [Selaginella moellendorffii]|eukprot:XP_002964179.1 uncharacterized protein LOC9654732 [Selaginella moellendorffii]
MGTIIALTPSGFLCRDTKRDPCVCPMSVHSPHHAAQSVRLSRRGFGVQLVLLPSLWMQMPMPAAALEQEELNIPKKNDPNSWDEYQGDGFGVKIPPGFEDTLEPDEFPIGEVPLYGNRAKPKVFAARFASRDGEEFVSVVIRRASQLKATFFEAKSITDLGKVDDIAKLFLPVGARLTAASSVTSEAQRVYYLYEYLAGSKHVIVSAAAQSGRIFVAAATAPQSRWKKDGRFLSSAAASFYLL